MTVLQIKNDVFRSIANIDDLNTLMILKEFLDNLHKDNRDVLIKKCQELKEAFQEVNLHSEGKIKLQTAKEFLDEL